MQVSSKTNFRWSPNTDQNPAPPVLIQSILHKTLRDGETERSQKGKKEENSGRKIRNDQVSQLYFHYAFFMSFFHSPHP